ncbi:CHASE4 domain-containing protein [Methylotenera sp.]|uniref:CHASE4 domain-containing protein n=1 Tax=Methylotenera sp. TaxID=2051956 RepID=UPI0027316618|nr:CHASE4 domain-containing protein [Methylotenera sp.]MDP2071436.1 CHASE4 domain-containing protein [Methylotenera sp.]MDP3005397.1 CHASE4 domain-containing protein [Methylotenera sp.]
MAEKHFTGLRVKMLVVVAAGMILLFTILFLAARMVLLDGYSKLESNKTVIQVNSAITLLKEQTQQLDGIVSEYGRWDDTYQYMVQPDSRYIESNYTNETFANLKVKAIVLVNSEGEAIYKRGFDFSTGKLWPIPKLLEQAVSKGGLFLDPSKDHLSGFFWTPEGICIVSATDVLPSGGNGLRRRGTLIMVRHLDQSLIAHVEKIIGAKLTIQPMLKDRFADMQQILANNAVVVKPLSDTQVAGYAMMKSVDEHANLVVATSSGREIFAQGEYTLSFLSWSTSIIALMLAGISWIFDRMVLLRLERMSEDVKRIGESANTKARVRKLNGQDELASLSHGINGMLERIEDSQYELQLEKDRAQVTLEGIADAVITSNEAGFVLYMNAAAERLTGVDFK